jgi:hypothetical protein
LLIHVFSVFSSVSSFSTFAASFSCSSLGDTVM